MKWLTIALFSLSSFALYSGETEEIHHVKIELELRCPPSDELQVLIDTITVKQGNVVDYEEWVKNLVDGMEKLEALLETGKIYQGGVSINHEIDSEEVK